MRHYCTYFDEGFLIQGLAMWQSLQRHEPKAVLWVLALDDFTANFLRGRKEAGLRVVPLAVLEAADPELAAVKPTRTRVEYYFTLSPCWPHWLLKTQPDLESVTYLDADLFLFNSPARAHAAMDAARASVLITPHRFPSWLRHYERHGRFNVGWLTFRRDSAGLGCLADWRAKCLEWCHDRLEGGRYADQKYLDAWPGRLRANLLVLEDRGVNAAPWNWGGGVPDSACDVESLVVFHFARFKPTRGDRWWSSGQLDYGIMSGGRRQAVYGPYWRALDAARREIQARHPGFDFPRRSARLGREFWRTLPLRAAFGGDWLRRGDQFHNLRGGLGAKSGQCLAALRTIFLRT